MCRVKCIDVDGFDFFFTFRHKLYFVLGKGGLVDVGVLLDAPRRLERITAGAILYFGDGARGAYHRRKFVKPLTLVVLAI